MARMRKIIGEPGGEQYVYDFDDMTCGQVEDAKGLFAFYNEKVIAPPSSTREFIVSGASDCLLRGYSYLFRKAVGSGATEPADPEQVYEFLRNLPSKYHAELEACKKDFFSRQRIRDEGWLRRTMQTFGVMGNLQRSLQVLNVPSASETSPEPPVAAPLFTEETSGELESVSPDTDGQFGYSLTEKPTTSTEPEPSTFGMQSQE